jgi:hypothetical protein
MYKAANRQIMSCRQYQRTKTFNKNILSLMPTKQALDIENENYVMSWAE